MFQHKHRRGASIPGLIVACLAVAIGFTGTASASCGAGKIQTAAGCQKPAAVKRQLLAIVKETKSDARLQAVVARVDVGGKTLLRRGFGQSETGVPARPRMNFRIGSMTIPVLTTLVYQLREEGRLRLSDPVSRWLPELPGGSRVTVRNLMNNTSGYLDWIQGSPEFEDRVLADPFRLWTDQELLSTALKRGAACDPGTCFSYAHTNFLILARVVRQVLRRGTLVAQLRKRVLRPLGIDLHFSRLAPIPAPALAAYTTDRGLYEQSTGWSPSWGLGNGMLATADIDDVARISTGVLAGRTLGKWARRDIARQYGPDLVKGKPGTYFAQGLIVVNGWRRQNPFFNGYMGNVALFPSRGITVALVATRGPNTTTPGGVNVTDQILGRIAEYLTPANLPVPPPAG